MNTAGNCYDRLAAGNQRLRFAISQRGIRRRTKQGGVGKLPLNVFELIKSLEILRRTDGRINKRRAHRRLANLFKLDAIAGGRESLKVLNYLGPTGEPAIVTRAETQDLFGRRYRSVLGDRDHATKTRVGLNREGEEEENGWN